jgi:hypothetical protein
MLSSTPMPGNPWPRDMILTIEDGPHALHELLWIREAWGLEPEESGLPPLLTDSPTPVDAGRSAPVAEWSAAWAELWRACLAHAAQTPDPSVFERLPDTAPGSAERVSLLEQLYGPSWRDRFGSEAFTDAFDDWQRGQFDKQTAPPVPSAESPERLALDDLVPAWRAGLTKLVLIPCRGTFTQRVGSSALLLTEETRDDPARYGVALRSFE